MAKKPLICDTYMGRGRKECASPKEGTRTEVDDSDAGSLACQWNLPGANCGGRKSSRDESTDYTRGFKKGGKVRGCGKAKRGVRKAKMY